MKKLKRAVIKEELVALTGDYKKAIMLNQFIYWSERIKDFDMFIKEEQDRFISHGEPEIAEKLELHNGWIYKKAEDLSEETMVDLGRKTMREHLVFLVEKGWLDERNNPRFNWDKTKQYRVNLIKIQQELLSLGFSLEGYTTNINFITPKVTLLDIREGENDHTNEPSEIPNETLPDIREGEKETPNEESKDNRSFVNAHGTFENDHGMGKKETALPKTTLEITTETTLSEGENAHAPTRKEQIIIYKDLGEDIDFVKMTEAEYQKLVLKMTEPTVIDYIERLDNQISMKGIYYASKQWYSHAGTVKNWYNKDQREQKKYPGKAKVKPGGFNDYEQRKYDFDELEAQLLKKTETEPTNMDFAEQLKDLRAHKPAAK